MKNLILTSALAFFLGVQTSNASVQTDIEKANKAGNAVFLVVTETGNADNVAAINLSKEAQKLSPKSTVVELNRSDKANESLVAKYRLAGANLPLVLVIAANGAEAGGIAYYKQTTAKDLVALIPSPKKAEVLKIINGGKPVFLVVSKKSMSTKEVLSNCKGAIVELKDSAKIVEVDFDDPAEKKFLTEVKITEIGKAPRTCVITSGGQIAGSFTDIPSVKILVASATKKAGGCCAPGSNQKCGPAPTKK